MYVMSWRQPHDAEASVWMCLRAPITPWHLLCSAVVFVWLCSGSGYYCTPSSNLTECKGHQQQNVHAEKETPPVTPGTHFCGAISAIRLLMPEPMRQEYRHAGDSVSHNVTELQIGGCMKITLIFILLKTFGGERTCPRVCFRNTYSTLAVHPEGLIQGWAVFKHL